MAGSTVLAASKDKAASTSTIQFNRDIRTILSDNCFACHGPDENKRKAKLRFDQKDVPFKPAKSGEIPIVAGDPAKSELIKRITSKDEVEKMPPPKSGKKLTAQQTHLSPVLMAAANSSGGVMGKMIDAQSIVVASTATNWYGHEGSILRYVFFHSVALAVLVGIMVTLQAYVLPFTRLVIR